jgi:hypothetical protein
MILALVATIVVGSEVPAPVPPGWLVVSGRAVASDGEVARFAEIAADCDRVVCVAAADGAFHCRIRRPAGGTLCVQHRLGRKRVTVPPGSDVLLGDIHLATGGTVHIVRPPHVHLPDGATVSLLRARKQVGTPQPIAPTEWFDFDGLAPGDYEILLAGAEPLQRRLFSTTIDGDSEQTVVLSFDPYRLTAVVHHGKIPLSGASVTLQGDAWTGTFTTDDQARFDAELWDANDYGVTIESPALPTSYFAMKRASIAESDWRVDIPARRIVAHVYDRDTGASLAEAVLNVESVTDVTRANRTIEPRDDGLFEISGATAGHYALSAVAPGYARSNKIELDLREGDGDRSLNIPLERAVVVRIVAMDAHGGPIANGNVIVELTPEGEARETHRTGATGAFTLTMPRRSEKVVYVLPATGSFAAARISSTQTEGATIVVPESHGAVRLRARTIAGEPLAGVAFSLRYGGQQIPAGVVRSLGGFGNAALTTDAAGEAMIPSLPAGSYDVAMYDAGSAEPAEWRQFTLGPGTTVVTQTFDRVESGDGPQRKR